MSVFRYVFLRWCGVCYFFPRCCSVDSPPMSPSLLYLKPLRNINTFLHIIYKSKKKTNLLCILNNVFQYSKIRTRKRNAKKSIKAEKKYGIQPFWNPESSTRNPESTGWNPESKTVMDSLTWGEQILIFWMLRNNANARRCSYFELGPPVEGSVFRL